MKICGTCNTHYPDDASFCSQDGQKLMSVDREPSYQLGTVLDDRYRLAAFLGAGGMGEVYRAEHVYIQKTVALKLLKPEITGSPEAVQRFYQEARASSSIGHRNIITIDDFGKLDDGTIYLAMEYLDGRSLASLIHQERLGYARTLGLILQVAKGLEAAHSRGILHRDIKPDNLYVIRETDGAERIKILDFGIAKMNTTSGDAPQLTKTGAIFGTPHYMSPEQALGEPLDERADIYSLGIVLYELVTGQVPFKAESFLGILTLHVTAEVPRPRALRPDMPEPLETLVLRMLEKNREKRPRDMGELSTLVERLLQELGQKDEAPNAEAAPAGHDNAPHDDTPLILLRNPVRKPEPAAPEPRPTRAPHKRLWPLVATSLCLVLLAGGGLFWWFGGRAKNDGKAPDGTSTTADAVPTPDTSDRPAPTPTTPRAIPSREITVTASGYLVSQGDLHFFPENVTDDDLTTWWTPRPNRDGRDSWVKLEWAGEKTVFAVDILPGSHHPHYRKVGDLWQKNNRLTRAALVFSDQSRVIITPSDMDRVQRLEFPAVKTRSVTLFPLEWKRGSSWNDLCISLFKPVELVTGTDGD